MAKRRRLETPSAPLEVSPAPAQTPPPIAQVIGEAAAVAAAGDALEAVERARREGRLVMTLPLDAVAAEHLVRDRMVADDEDMAALTESIRAHGQRTPVEVVALDGAGEAPSYGLISGWRRLAALRALHAETGEERFGHVLALLRAPQDAGEAYVAMVEENEIRANLSYYERARIAVLAAKGGAFEDVRDALRALYGNVSRAKRSKIGSFVSLHEELGDLLQFPTHIPERLGLRLAAGIKEGRAGALRAALKGRADSPEAEAKALERALGADAQKAPDPTGAAAKPPRELPGGQERLAPGLNMELTGSGKNRQLVLTGPKVTEEMVARLRVLAQGRVLFD